jgi:hypothetical protein
LTKQQIAKRFILLLIIGVLAFSLPPVLLTTGSYLYYQWSGVILPGIHVGSVDVGSLSVADAQRDIDNVYNQRQEMLLIEVPDAERSWSVNPIQFGLQVDAEFSAQKAYQVGRQGGVINQVQTMLSVLRKGEHIKPQVRFDRDTAEKELASWEKVLSREPVNARLELVGSRVFNHAAEPGLHLDSIRTLDVLTNSYEEVYFQQGWIPLFTSSVEPIRGDVSQAVQQLEEMLAGAPRIRAYDPVSDEHFIWSPDRATVASWLSITDVDSLISIELDSQAVRAYVEDLKQSLGTERYLDSREIADAILSNWGANETDIFIVNYNPSEYIVEPGDTLVSIGFKVNMPYWKLEEYNPSVITQGLTTGQTLQVPPRDDLLTLPVVPVKRIVISLLEQRMWVYEDGNLKWEHIISTGIPNSPTLPGIFQISSHFENAYASIWDLYMPHFMGIYDAVPNLTNGIHGLPVLSGGGRLWANVLGSPASYGCIILDLDAAEQLYYWAEEGVVVEIRE